MRFQEFWGQPLDSFWELSEEAQDFCMCDYVMFLRDECLDTASPQKAAEAVAACQKHFGGRRKFPATYKIIDAWRSEHPPDQAAPMPLPVAMAMVTLCVLGGCVNEGVLILVTYCALLRAGEAVALLPSDVLGPTEHGLGNFVVVCIRKTKCGAANTERRVIDNPEAVAFLAAYKAFVGPGVVRFAPSSYQRMRLAVRACCRALGLAAEAFRTHSLRRGAASTLALAGVPFADVMLRGGWASERSCRLYVRQGEVLLTRWRQQLPLGAWQRISQLARLPRTALALVVLEHPVGERGTLKGKRS